MHSLTHSLTHSLHSLPPLTHSLHSLHSLNLTHADEIGDALADLFEQGVVQRSDLWITGKLNNPYHHKEHVRPHLEKTLLDLRLDHLGPCIAWPPP